MDKRLTNNKVSILTEGEIFTFQKLAKKLMGRELTFEEAEVQGTRLIQAMELILGSKKKMVAKQAQKEENREINEQ